jgi:hypothetical protein
MTRRHRFASSLVAVAVFAAGVPALARVQAQTQGQAPATEAVAQAADGELEVTVTYKGKGEVSAKNEVTVFLFTDPNINETSTPIGAATIERNGGQTTFTGLQPLVYIAVIYDDKGTYERKGPPEPGTPVSVHGLAEGGQPIGIKPGKGAKVAVAFDDSLKM